jgi:hypothetical protein
MKGKSAKVARSRPNGEIVIKDVLAYSRPRPSSSDKDQFKKTAYSIRFAERMAELISKDLRVSLKGITATTKRDAASVGGKKKQLDINFSTPSLGLALGISLKSVHLGDVQNGRYTHNMKRNEEELRIEASGYHKRQPYAVMVAVLFLPFDSCEDGIRDASSFGSWVRHLRPYCGRRLPTDEVDRFERIFIGLYELEGSDLRFFDVESAPPKNGRPPLDGALIGNDGVPRRLLSYEEFLAAAYEQYLERNSAGFSWADGDSEPLEADELEPSGEDSSS